MLEDPVLGRSTPRFALQWHITHACELHCRHCYDRTRPSPLSLEQSREIVAGMKAFCRDHEVQGAIILTGGNPFLHPDFEDIYGACVEAGMTPGILGNPVTAERLDALCRIRKPRYFQVSLEGLEPHNDSIRGPGTYARALAFLDLLRERAIESHVMITLTRANLREIVPLCEALKGRVDHVTWNRLTQFGEGANLELPTREELAGFMREYAVARVRNRHMGLKDNLFNIPIWQLGLPLFGGCTGYGCGAAFNFMALLPQGDAHACRKLPSRIGNVLDEGFEAVYQSEAAARYRRGCTACDGCEIRSRCGGCMAVAQGAGLDPFTERDPLCFWEERDAHFPSNRETPVERGEIRRVLRLATTS